MEGYFSHDEVSRLEVLRSLKILDTQPEFEYDCIVTLAAKICAVPIATISLIDGHRQWFKASVGTEETGSARDVSFCQHTILSRYPLIIPDAREDDRFRNSPFVTGPMSVRFYCGVPIHVMGKNVGALCAVDRVPRSITTAQVETLEVLATLISSIAYKDFLYLETKDRLDKLQTREPSCWAA